MKRALAERDATSVRLRAQHETSLRELQEQQAELTSLQHRVHQARTLDTLTLHLAPFPPRRHRLRSWGRRQGDGGGVVVGSDVRGGTCQKVGVCVLV